MRSLFDKVKDFSAFNMLKKMKINIFIIIMNVLAQSNVEQTDRIKENNEDSRRTYPAQK